MTRCTNSTKFPEDIFFERKRQKTCIFNVLEEKWIKVKQKEKERKKRKKTTNSFI
jgi:hypothetical protein